MKSQHCANKKTTFGSRKDFRGHLVKVGTSCQTLLIAIVCFLLLFKTVSVSYCNINRTSHNERIQLDW